MNKEQLCAFCEPDHPKMCGPFSLGDYTYATNGYILVRVPRVPDVGEWEAVNEGASKLFDQIDYTAVTAALVDIPAFKLPAPDKCGLCKGTGKTTTCPECEGDGEVTLDNDFHSYDCECQTCDGNGHLSGGASICRICNGTGNQRVVKKIAIGGAYFSSHYLTLMKETMQGVKIAPTAPEGINYFKWDGGDGLLMPMRG